MKDDIRRRREARIRQLTLQDVQGYSIHENYERRHPSNMKEFPASTSSSTSDDFVSSKQTNRDPEQVWRDTKQAWAGRYGWNETEHTRRRPRFAKTFIFQFGCTVVLCLVIAGATKWEVPYLEGTKKYVTAALSENMDFQTIAVWAEATFGGSPAFIPIWNNDTQEAEEAQAKLGFQPPTEGSVIQPFALTLQGVEIRPDGGGADVVSAAVGRVIRVIQDPKAGTTVVIQHANQYVTHYERLEECFVRKDDWVEAGQQIGRMPAATSSGTIPGLFFALKKNGQFIDPAEVMNLD